MQIHRFALFLLSAALVLLGPAALAQTERAPEYVSSEPEAGSTVDEAPDRVTITFSQPLDGSSYIKVESPCAGRVDDGHVQITANQMSVGIAKKPSGHYQVNYFAKSLGGVTGQESGQFHFMVKGGTGCDGGHEGHDGGHEGHDGGHGGHGGGHDGHEEGHGGEHSGHTGGGHSGHTGSVHGTHDEHATHGDASGHSGHGEHEGHAGGAGHDDHAGKHSDHSKNAGHDHEGDAGDLPPVASDGVTQLPPDGKTVLLALGLATMLGGLGGWVLRVSAPS